MSGLAQRLQADLTEAMKARDELRLSVLRMALTAMKTEEVAGGAARDLTDDDVLKVLAREAKKRRESAQAYDDASRPELADRERAEGGVLAAYLPTPLSDNELAELVKAAIAASGATGPGQMGQVMKAVTPRVGGRADGAKVAAEVRRQLAG
jgi:hypothetical protein